MADSVRPKCKKAENAGKSTKSTKNVFNPKGSSDEKYRQQTEVNKADREQAKVQGQKTNWSYTRGSQTRTATELPQHRQEAGAQVHRLTRHR